MEQPLLVMLLGNFPPEGEGNKSLSFHTCTKFYQTVLAEEFAFWVETEVIFPDCRCLQNRV